MRRKADLASRLIPLLVLLLGAVAFGLAAASPLQRGREAVWIFGGLTGVLALALLAVQPLLMSGLVRPVVGRRLHRGLGAAILGLAVAHVAGLWIYSPEDITDALLLRAPTPFSAWGVASLAGLVAAALVAVLRRPIPPHLWKALHLSLAVIGGVSAVVHAWMILGAMEPVSKALLCLAILVSLAVAVASSLRLLRTGRQGSA